MKSFYAMRRANGDWFAVGDNGHVRMPIFKSKGDLEQLRKTDGNTASFLIVADPSRNLKYGLHATFTELAPLMVDLAKCIPEH